MWKRSQSKPVRVRSRKADLALLISSILFSLVILEVGVRLLLPPPDQIKMKVFDAEIGKTLRPGYEGSHVGVEVKFNSHGLRSPEIPLEKPDDTYRILVLGDSWTFGVGVPQDKTYPAQLELLLREQNPDRKIEVINAGVSGYETYNEAVYFGRSGHKFEPDLVIIGFYPVNDLHDKKSKYERHARERAAHPTWYFIRTFPKTHLRSYQYYGYLRSDLKRSYRTWRQGRIDFNAGPEELDNSYDVEWTLLYRDDFQGWITAKESLASIVEIADKTNCPVVLAVFPDLRELKHYRTSLQGRFYPKLEKTAVGLGIKVLDMAPSLYPYEGKEGQIALGDTKGSTHPNIRGHRLLAEYLAQHLDEMAVSGGTSVGSGMEVAPLSER